MTEVKLLTDAEVDDMAFGYAPSGAIGELRELVRAVESRLSGQVTDSQRLDFVLSNSNLRLNGDDMHGWFFWDVSNGLTPFGESHATSRQAIDAAIVLKKSRDAVMSAKSGAA